MDKNASEPVSVQRRFISLCYTIYDDPGYGGDADEADGRGALLQNLSGAKVQCPQHEGHDRGGRIENWRGEAGHAVLQDHIDAGGQDDADDAGLQPSQNSLHIGVL